MGKNKTTGVSVKPASTNETDVLITSFASGALADTLFAKKTTVQGQGNGIKSSGNVDSPETQSLIQAINQMYGVINAIIQKEKNKTSQSIQQPDLLLEKNYKGPLKAFFSEELKDFVQAYNFSVMQRAGIKAEDRSFWNMYGAPARILNWYNGQPELVPTARLISLGDRFNQIHSEFNELGTRLQNPYINYTNQGLGNFLEKAKRNNDTDAVQAIQAELLSRQDKPVEQYTAYQVLSRLQKAITALRAVQNEFLAVVANKGQLEVKLHEVELLPSLKDLKKNKAEPGKLPSLADQRSEQDKLEDRISEALQVPTGSQFYPRLNQFKESLTDKLNNLKNVEAWFKHQKFTAENATLTYDDLLAQGLYSETLIMKTIKRAKTELVEAVNKTKEDFQTKLKEVQDARAGLYFHQKLADICYRISWYLLPKFLVNFFLQAPRAKTLREETVLLKAEIAALPAYQKQIETVVEDDLLDFLVIESAQKREIKGEENNDFALNEYFTTRLESIAQGQSIESLRDSEKATLSHKKTVLEQGQKVYFERKVQLLIDQKQGETKALKETINAWGKAVPAYAALATKLAVLVALNDTQLSQQKFMTNASVFLRDNEDERSTVFKIATHRLTVAVLQELSKDDVRALVQWIQQLPAQDKQERLLAFAEKAHKLLKANSIPAEQMGVLTELWSAMSADLPESLCCELNEQVAQQKVVNPLLKRIADYQGIADRRSAGSVVGLAEIKQLNRDIKKVFAENKLVSKKSLAEALVQLNNTVLTQHTDRALTIKDEIKTLNELVDSTQSLAKEYDVSFDSTVLRWIMPETKSSKKGLTDKLNRQLEAFEGVLTTKTTVQPAAQVSVSKKKAMRSATNTPKKKGLWDEFKQGCDKAIEASKQSIQNGLKEVVEGIEQLADSKKEDAQPAVTKVMLDSLSAQLNDVLLSFEVSGTDKQSFLGTYLSALTDYVTLLATQSSQNKGVAYQTSLHTCLLHLNLLQQNYRLVSISVPIENTSIDKPLLGANENKNIDVLINQIQSVLGIKGTGYETVMHQNGSATAVAMRGSFQELSLETVALDNRVS